MYLFSVVIIITIDIQEEAPGCTVVGKGSGSYNVFDFKALLVLGVRH